MRLWAGEELGVGIAVVLDTTLSRGRATLAVRWSHWRQSAMMPVSQACLRRSRDATRSDVLIFLIAVLVTLYMLWGMK